MSTKPTDAAKRIEAFIAAIRAYLAIDSILHVRAENEIPGGPGEFFEIADERQGKAATARRAAIDLPQAIEDCGHDSTALMAIMHCLDGGGGANAIRPLWADAKVKLQRTAMQLRRGHYPQSPFDSHADTTTPTRMTRPLTPAAPVEPTRIVSLATAAKWFGKDPRWLKGQISTGKIRAEQMSDRGWIFCLEQVPAHHHGEADPEAKRH